MSSDTSRLTVLAFVLALVACQNKQAAPPASTGSSMPAPADPPPASPGSATTTPADSPPAPDAEPASATPDPAARTALAKGNNDFAFDLWSKLPAGNLAVSPTSIGIALAMTWGGAKGGTADEMRGALHLDGPPERVLSRWGQLAKSLEDPGRKLKLGIANRLFSDKSFDLDTVFFDITFKAFAARVDVFDFRGDADGSRKKINTWVEKQTENRIKDLLPPGAVDARTRLVLVNAIYFLADWADPFEKYQTRSETFHLSANQTKTTPMMNRQGRYRYASGDGAALVELPYKGNSASMYVVVPDARDGLAALERKLPATLRGLQAKLSDQQVLVALPKFVIDPAAPLELSRHLGALGMKQAFDADKADFTGIGKSQLEGERIFISQVLHKAFVKVDEKGTEAAAATAVAMRGTGGPPAKPIEVRADRPFLFMIVDRTSSLILFMGRVVDPLPPA